MKRSRTTRPRTRTNTRLIRRFARELFHYLPRPVRLACMLLMLAFGWEKPL